MKRSLLASFSRAAPRYREHAAVQEAMADWLAQWLPADRSGRAVELGAGPGVLTRRLVPWPGGLTATDISSEMCAAGSATLPGALWRVMAAEEPTGGPWDWILCSSLLQWTENPEAVFAMWRRSLATGGRVLAGLYVEGSLPELGELLQGIGPLTWRPPEEWERALSSAGFSVVRRSVEHREFHYPTARVFLRALHRIGAAPERRLAPGDLRRLLEEYERRFREPGGVRASWCFYRFEAM